MPSRKVLVDQLREQIAQVAPARPPVSRLLTRVPLLDARIGGWPRGCVSSVLGNIGSGRLGLLLPTMRHLTLENRFVALVDSLSQLHPPGLPGVRLDRLVLVRPGVHRAGWAAEQLAQSGALSLVILLDPPQLYRSGRRLLQAAQRGDAPIVVVWEQRDGHLPDRIRLLVRDRSVHILRGDRQLGSPPLALPDTPLPGEARGPVATPGSPDYPPPETR
jgi:hypothetical protein